MQILLVNVCCQLLSPFLIKPARKTFVSFSSTFRTLNKTTVALHLNSFRRPDLHCIFTVQPSTTVRAGNAVDVFHFQEFLVQLRSLRVIQKKWN